jgi:hypothetical protein
MAVNAFGGGGAGLGRGGHGLGRRLGRVGFAHGEDEARDDDHADDRERHPRELLRRLFFLDLQVGRRLLGRGAALGRRQQLRVIGRAPLRVRQDLEGLLHQRFRARVLRGRAAHLRHAPLVRELDVELVCIPRHAEDLVERLLRMRHGRA